MRDFARVTKLHDVAGRGDYISNPNRQEVIVAKSDPVDWKPYHDYEKAHQRTNKANNEGREVIIQLPNGWAGLPDHELTEKAARLAEVAAGKKTDLQWAVHWNKAHTNFHMHAVFSERTATENFRLYDRDIYHTADGKVARSRKDRARGPDGKELPPVHRKGELASLGLSAKDTRYKARNWVPTVKDALRNELVRFGAVLEPKKAPYELHQYHQGKGPQAADIAMKNRAIEKVNEQIRKFEKGGMKPENLHKLKARALDVLHRSEMPIITLDKEKNRVNVVGATVQQVREFQHRQSEAPARVAAPIAEPKPAPIPPKPRFDMVSVARQLESHRADFIKATMQAASRTEYRENPVYRQRAAQIAESVKTVTYQTASIEHLQADLSKLGLFHGKEKKELQTKIDGLTALRDGGVKRLKELGVSELSQATEAIKKNKDLAALELEKVRASRESRGADNRVAEAKAAFLDLARTVPEDERQAVLDEMRSVREPSAKGMAAYQAEISAQRELDSKVTPPRTQEHEMRHDRSWGMER